MSYEPYNRKGTTRERKARAAQLVEQIGQKIADAEQASARADRTGDLQDHLRAARAWRRVIYPATRLDLDATTHRDAVRRHMLAAQLLQKDLSA